ncbi:MAG: glycoside hydrolase family 25 [Thermoleophilia bacterium]|nr:glycoside hydrolase family 25 [Thermoleophilia bacterium]
MGATELGGIAKQFGIEPQNRLAEQVSAHVFRPGNHPDVPAIVAVDAVNRATLHLAPLERKQGAARWFEQYADNHLVPVTQLKPRQVDEAIENARAAGLVTVCAERDGRYVRMVPAPPQGGAVKARNGVERLGEVARVTLNHVPSKWRPVVAIAAPAAAVLGVGGAIARNVQTHDTHAADARLRSLERNGADPVQIQRARIAVTALREADAGAKATATPGPLPESVAKYVGASEGAPADSSRDWNADFAAWVAKTAGSPIGYDGKGALDPAHYVARWAPDAGALVATTARAAEVGDIVVLDNGDAPDSFGVVAVAGGDELTLVQGNVASAPGTAGAVSRVVVRRDDPRILSYISPVDAKAVSAMPEHAETLRGQALAGQPPLSMIDVSVYQGRIDWTAVKASGQANVAVMRSTINGQKDSTYDANKQGAASNGIPHGAYNYAKPSTVNGSVDQHAIQDATNYLAQAGLQRGDLAPVLDLEETKLNPADTAHWASVWADTVSAAIGVTPILYTGPSFFNRAVDAAQAPELAQKFRLWIAHYGVAAPLIPHGFTDWVAWQNGGAPVPGIAHDVDHDFVRDPFSLLIR